MASSKSAISKPEIFTQRVETVRSGRANEHYTETEAERYTDANTMIEREMALECMNLIDGGTGSIAQKRLLLDLGIGSGLCAHALREAGHLCIGIDVAWNMLALARQTSKSGTGAMELMQHDLGKGLPLRPHTADGAISVAVLQWVCDDAASMAALLAGVKTALAPGARAAFQFYPTPDGALAALAASRAADFRAELLVDMPHATRAKKLMLVVEQEPLVEPLPVAAADDTPRALCPLSWPMPATCACESCWHGGAPPTVFPPRLHASSCCDGLNSDAGAAGLRDDDGSVSAWHERLRTTCGCACLRNGDGTSEAVLTTTATVLAEMQQARAASIGRLQHGHMKYVRRVLYALLAIERAASGGGAQRGSKKKRRRNSNGPSEGTLETTTAVAGAPHATSANPGAGTGTGSEGAPSMCPSIAPTIPAGLAAEVSLYLGGRKRYDAPGGEVLDAACAYCLLVRLRGDVNTCMALSDALCARLDDASMALEHVHVTALAAGDSHPSLVPLGEPTVAMLPIDGAAPHGCVRLDLVRAEQHTMRRGDAGQEEAVHTAACKLLAVVVHLRREGLCVCALDALVSAESDAETATDRQLTGLTVAMALREMSASGAGHATAEAAQSAADLTGWSAAVRRALKEASA